MKNNHAHYLISSTLLISLLFVIMAGMIGCASPGYKPGAPTMIRQQPSLFDSPFEELWKKHTIWLSKSMETGGLLNGNLGGGMRGPFPVFVQATLMDSILIAEGLSLFADLASLNPGEKEEYRQRYYNSHNIREHIYVWAVVRTPYHESYLDLDRWTFFIQDGEGQQFEPTRVTEVPIERTSPYERFEGALSPREVELPSFMKPDATAKVVELYFPRKTYYGDPIVTAQTKELTMGVVHREDVDERAEGVWLISEFPGFRK